MFESLSDRLNNTFDRLRGKGKLTEADITSAMRDIRMALLEADVNFKVVKDFVAKTKERCMTPFWDFYRTSRVRGMGWCRIYGNTQRKRWSKRPATAKSRSSLICWSRKTSCCRIC